MAIPELMERLRRNEENQQAQPQKQTSGTSGLKLRLPSKTMTFTGVDIGTTKICAIIGQIDPKGKVTILSVASTPSHGLRRGVVINLEETVESIRSAIRKAENIAQVSVRDVFVGIAGGHIECHQLEGEIKVANAERGITKSDVRHVMEIAIENRATVDREILHAIPQRFHIDDGPIMDPLGFCSKVLKSDVLLVTAAVTSAQNIIRAVSQAGYRVSGIYLEPLASSLAVLGQKEKDLGVMLIDIGGGTSDVAIWTDGAIRYTGVVPFGGDSVTEDVSKGLEVDRYDAENLKKRHGHCLSTQVDVSDTIQVSAALVGRTVTHSRQFLAEIIQCRLEEILYMVKKKVEKIPAFDEVYGGIVFTGGGSLQQGICELGEKMFNKPCVLGVPSGLYGLSSVVQSPIYSTGVGLVLYGLEYEREQSFLDGNAFSKIVKKLKGFIDWYG